MNNFALMYPRAAKLGLTVIDAGPGFDLPEVASVLGAERFAELKAGLKRDFVCQHRHYSADEFEGTEVHCCYAEDLEEFLQAGG